MKECSEFDDLHTQNFQKLDLIQLVEQLKLKYFCRSHVLIVSHLKIPSLSF